MKTAYDNYDTEKNSTTLTTSYQNVEDAATRLEKAGRTSEELATLQETKENGRKFARRQALGGLLFCGRVWYTVGWK